MSVRDALTDLQGWMDDLSEAELDELMAELVADEELAATSLEAGLEGSINAALTTFKCFIPPTYNMSVMVH